MSRYSDYIVKKKLTFTQKAFWTSLLITAGFGIAAVWTNPSELSNRLGGTAGVLGAVTFILAICAIPAL